MSTSRSTSWTAWRCSRNTSCESPSPKACRACCTIGATLAAVALHFCSNDICVTAVIISVVEQGGRSPEHCLADQEGSALLCLLYKHPKAESLTMVLGVLSHLPVCSHAHADWAHCGAGTWRRRQPR